MKLSERLEKELAKSKLMQNVWVPRPEILLCPNVPKPLHRMPPRVIYGDSWWNKTRQAAYRSTNFHCLACGVSKFEAHYHKWLEGHELYEIDYEAGLMTYIETVPLCHFCHNFIHDGRMLAQLRKKEIHHHKYAAILRHGDAVLAKAGLQKMSQADREKEFTMLQSRGLIADWKKWRLVLDGRKYAPKYKSFEEWKKDHDGPTETD